MTATVTALCVAVELVASLSGGAFHAWLAAAGGVVPARFLGPVPGMPDVLPPALTLVTHMFIHGGFAHLAMNMVFFWWIGRLTEWAIGPWRFLMLFLASGICGAALQALLSPHSVVPVVGASGAISGIFAVYLYAYASSDEEATHVLGVALSADAVRALRYAALWIGLQLLTGVVFNEGGQGGIAIWSHIGGFVAGLGYQFAVLGPRRGNG